MGIRWRGMTNRVNPRYVMLLHVIIFPRAHIFFPTLIIIGPNENQKWKKKKKTVDLFHFKLAM